MTTRNQSSTFLISGNTIRAQPSQLRKKSRNMKKACRTTFVKPEEHPSEDCSHCLTKMMKASTKLTRRTATSDLNSRKLNPHLVGVETKDDKKNNQRCLYFDRTFSDMEMKFISDIEKHK